MVSCGVGRRWDLELALLWLWCRPLAATPILPLAGNFHMPHVQPSKKKDVNSIFSFFPFSFCLFRAAPKAYRGSKARG